MAGELDLEYRPSDQFTTTHWSVVVRAGEKDPEASGAALNQLCRIYWPPIYSFIRRHRSASHHEAEDLTQEFFRHLFEYGTIRKADRDKGRFRTLLLRVLRDVLANESKRVGTLKRGGGCELISLDAAMAEEMYALEPVESVTPEKLFERRWAITLLKQVLTRLQKENVENGKEELFAKLSQGLNLDDGEVAYEQWAADLGMSVNSVKVAMHRLRRRYAELLRNEVAQTVSSAEEIEDEIRHLFAVTAT